MKLPLPLLISCLFFCEINAQEYMKVKDTSKINGEQAYILPKVALVVEVQCIATTFSKGTLFDDQNYTDLEIAQYAIRYGVDKIIYKGIKKGDSTSYKIIDDSIKISMKSVPDYSKIFYVNPNKRWYKDQRVSFTYSTDGILSEGESSAENKSFDLVVKGLSGVASIAGSFFMGKSILSKSDPVVYKIPALEEALAKFDLLGTQSNYEIYKDLKNRYQKAYDEVFARYFYKEKKEVKIMKFLYVPSSVKPETIKDSLRTALFAFDKGKITLNKELKNEILAKDGQFGDMGQFGYFLVFERNREQQLNYFTERGEDELGFAYNIPLNVQLKLVKIEEKKASKENKKTEENKKIVDKEKTEAKEKTAVLYYEQVKIPQYGAVGYSKAKNKKLSFQLDPLTGELKRLTIEGKAVSADQVGSIAPVAVDAVKLAKGDSAATKLENEVKELENMKKKRDLIKELEVQ
ncbi:hypothetical protein [Flavobacterium gelatinilyticum]|uniref:hypothetical protein n=1 Tax=Flavobacterium gelatinilyticum TaxID=3003260 RepID=UPI002481319C|nr:hypothetical protein [Flavobacterium gelatinilyticum]